ncbi:hypothetical protein SAMN04488487_4549 [Pseudomonas fluorescens]|uniref:Uncharacterized protein n=1 Tax=Pseudomonas fluorescens TaxID=294 RepID=A0ABY1TJ02_PSEFL|nr:hypothetical protein ALQ35_00701 [Pseudomonas fluorescens]SNY12042.1 hypothetical protein SAMN04488487_4549 [Pseudomonas fluorescens]
MRASAVHNPDWQHRSTVGAGLLAKAVGQSIFPLTDTAHSRASPLPHFALRFTQASVPVLLRNSHPTIAPPRSTTHCQGEWRCWQAVMSYLLMRANAVHNPDWQHRSTVGAGLLAKAVGQSISPLTDTAHSRASPLPHFALRFTQASVPVLLRNSHPTIAPPRSTTHCQGEWRC